MALEDLYPLSAVQQGLLFETLADPDGARYVQQIRWRAQGPLNTDRYRAAWQRIVDRHAVLRTFVAGDDEGRPLQAVVSSAELPFHEEDFRCIPDAERLAGLERYCRADRARGIGTDAAPMCRLTLVRLGESTWESIWTFHHLLLDGWSIGRLINELGPLYADPDAVLPEPPPYRDYIAWRERLGDRSGHDYWTDRLAGLTASAGLDLPPGPPTDEQVAERTRVLDQRTEAGLRATARRMRVTPSVFAQAAWAVVLSRYTDNGDVVFGTTVSGRPPALPRVEDMVGLFINTVPVRARMRPGMTAEELVRQLHADQLNREPHEHTPLHELHAARRATGLPDPEPLFDTLFIYENYPVSAPFPDERILPDVELVQGKNTEITNYAVSMSLVPQDRLRVFASFDPRRFDPAAVERLLDHYATALDTIVGAPERPLDDLDLLGAEERRQLDAWSRGATLDVPQAPLHELVDVGASAHPDRVAVVVDETGEQVTYAELVRRGDAVAAALTAAGVEAGDLVGVCLPRGPGMVEALLGVLKAGAAYLPLDPDLPSARLEFMLADAEPKALVGRSGSPVAVDVDMDEVIHTAADAAELQSDPIGRLRKHPSLGPDAPAYCLYTSGSTGRPKGVLVGHGGIVNRLAGMLDSYRIGPDDRVLQKTPLGFDVSGWEVFLPLVAGARLVLADRDAHRDPARLARTIAAHGITVAHFVPSMLTEFVRVAEAPQLASLRLVMCSGEVLPAHAARRITELCPAELHNLYGPTEASIDVSACHVARPVGDDAPPIGRPVQNTELVVLDRRMRPTPVGVPGELYIGGPQLALGYHRRPELTAERFPARPGKPGERLYRTGDLARWRMDGSLDFLGRLDDQVKVNGVRIELGEIEHELRALEGVAQAVVSARNGRLHAHLVADGAERPELLDLRTGLARTLPRHMIPAAFHWLPELPFLPNGKVDRSRLRDTGGEVERAAGFTPPRGRTEELVARVWRETLGVERVGAHDEFTELGGGSLDSVRIAFKLREELGRRVELRELVRHTTVAALAAALDGRLPEGGERWSPDREVLALPSPLPARAATRGENVLVTGGTGYLGAYLIGELAACTTGRLHCLVRAATEDEARKRLEENLLRHGVVVPAHRLTAVPGDLGRPGLGLESTVFRELAGTADVIVHAGAHIDMLADHDRLAPVNIGGTREILRLAATGRLAPVYYVSTGDPKNELLRAHVGYALTKWRAERLVDEARAAGVPAYVVRLPRLTPAGGGGPWNDRDMALRLLQLCLELGAAPPLGAEEWVPVDEAARLVAEFAVARDGRAHAHALLTVAAEQPVSLDALIDIVRARGHHVAPVSAAEWDAALAARFPLEHELLRTLAEERDGADSPQSVDDWGVLPRHRFTVVRVPGVGEALLRRYATDLLSRPNPEEGRT